MAHSMTIIRSKAASHAMLDTSKISWQNVVKPAVIETWYTSAKMKSDNTFSLIKSNHFQTRHGSR